MDKEFIEKSIETYEKLKQECEKLKEDYAELLKLLQRNNDSFEQFEVLKRENEELKKVIKNNETAYTTEINIYNRASEDLLKENTELSEENNILKQSENEAIEIIAELKAENKKLKKEIKYITEWKRKLNQVLEEIREILIICKEFKTCEKCNFFKDCNKDLEGCILDKINEVLK